MSNVFKKNKFTNVSNILPKVVEKLGLDRRLNEQALFYLWPSILDKAYADRSIPLYIDAQHVLLIAVEDSSTAQELSFIKPKLIKKLKEVGKQLDLKIEGIRFDLKQFHQARKQLLEKNENVMIKRAAITTPELQALELTQAECDEIELFKSEIKKVVDIKSSNNLAENEAFSKRLVNLIETQMRLKKWHKSQNLPFCKQCYEPVFQTGVLLCHYCLQQKQTESQYDNKAE
jgi:hypothetical protein